MLISSFCKTEAPHIDAVFIHNHIITFVLPLCCKHKVDRPMLSVLLSEIMHLWIFLGQLETGASAVPFLLILNLMGKESRASQQAAMSWLSCVEGGLGWVRAHARAHPYWCFDLQTNFGICDCQCCQGSQSSQSSEASLSDPSVLRLTFCDVNLPGHCA